MDYSLKLGPLRFITALDDIQEALGDQLEQVGAAVIPGDRRPRPFNLTLPVMAARSESDPYKKGMQLRRQVRQLMENTAWRMQGLPFTWDVDPDLAGWLLVGGGDLTESDSGLTFGEFKLTLTDCYIAGRPGTHRQGRRLDLGDRRTGLVPRDSWGKLHSTDFNAQPADSSPLVLPGDIDYPDLVNTPATRYPLPGNDWRQAAAWANPDPGGVIAFRPDYDNVFGNFPDFTVADFGSCRVFAKPDDGSPPVSTTTAGDLDPQTHYGWEQVLGPRTNAHEPLVIDNGICRVMYMGPAASQGLLIQRWITNRFQNGIWLSGHMPITDPAYQNTADWVPIELTPERVVIEVAASDTRQNLRIILQRGWTGPRLEQRNVPSSASSSGNGWGLRTEAGGGSVTQITPTFIYEVKNSGGSRVALVAKGASNIEVAASSQLVTGSIAGFYLPSPSKVMALQISMGQLSGASASWPVDRFASMSLEDARPVPVLVER